jgi:hypothetical protein
MLPHRSAAIAAVIHLGFLSHLEFQPVVLLGVLLFEVPNESLNAVVAVSEAELFPPDPDK